jgi:hypothetical protein
MTSPNIYTDASHRGEIVAIGIYNDTTGVAKAMIVGAISGRDNATYGEMLGIHYAATTWPGCIIHTDSRECMYAVKHGIEKPGLEGVYATVNALNCTIEAIPRGRNIVADWLSRSPIDFDCTLPAGLSALTPPPRLPKRGKRKAREDAAKERTEEYGAFLDAATPEALVSAPQWIQGWVLGDALSKRHIEGRIDEDKQELHLLRNERQKLKAEIRKLQQRNSKLELKRAS